MVKHLETGETYTYHADQPFPTASLIKFPIMIAAYDGSEKQFPLHSKSHCTVKTKFQVQEF